MDVNRKGNQLTISFDTEEEAIGLNAYLSGTVHEVSPEIASKGQWIYNWFFTAVNKLATNFKIEKSVSTMSHETMQALPPAQTSSKKAKKR